MVDRKVVDLTKFQKDQGGDVKKFYEEMVRRFDSAVSGTQNQIMQADGKISNLAMTLQHVALKLDALISCLLESGVLTVEKMEESEKVIQKRYQEVSEALKDKLEGFEVVDEAITPDHFAVVKMSAMEVGQDYIERDMLAQIPADPKLHSLTQSKDLVANIAGKKAGDSGQFVVMIPKGEPNNPFSGKNVEVTYEILKVKKRVEKPNEDKKPG